jgi:tetratricopeptide (TPR) repeat protein
MSLRHAAPALAGVLILAAGPALAADDARACLEASDRAAALSACDRALAAGDLAAARRTDLRIARIHLLKDLDRGAEAVTEAERLVKDAGMTVETLNARGDAMLGQERYSEADRDYGAALRLKPDDATAHYGRGALRLLRNDYPSALREFDAVIAVAPATPDVYVYRALAHSGALDNAAALADLDLARKRAP